MILAAGEGRRLRPLTDTVPKALVEVGGVTMLERTARRLAAAGVTEIVVNTFHLADQVEAYVRSKKGFGLRFEFSRETVLLDTGGGLKKAAPFFDDGKPFFVHNVDILTDLDLGAMYRAQLEKKPLATLAVQKRSSDRRFLFDDGRLCGWESAKEGRIQWAKGPVSSAERRAFAGVHVASPELLLRMKEDGVFSINTTYLRLAGEGAPILGWDAGDAYWADIGSAEKLEKARKDLP